MGSKEHIFPKHQATQLLKGNKNQPAASILQSETKTMQRIRKQKDLASTKKIRYLININITSI